MCKVMSKLRYFHKAFEIFNNIIESRPFSIYFLFFEFVIVILLSSEKYFLQHFEIKERSFIKWLLKYVQSHVIHKNL